MKLRSMVFELGAVKPAQWPEDGLPEFAFVGRSNVGKSSLLNRLLNRKSLARVSGTPGKTQQINFFRINDDFRFADLPGYGYASVSKSSRALFAKMMETYLTKREPLEVVFHLIDIRHDVMAIDFEAHEWMRAVGVPLCVVATKMDKLSKSQAKPAVDRIRKQLRTTAPVVGVSAEKGMGIELIWETIEGALDARRNLPPKEIPTEVRLSDQGADENQ